MNTSRAIALLSIIQKQCGGEYALAVKMGVDALKQKQTEEDMEFIGVAPKYVPDPRD